MFYTTGANKASKIFERVRERKEIKGSRLFILSPWGQTGDKKDSYLSPLTCQSRSAPSKGLQSFTFVPEGTKFVPCFLILSPGRSQ